ncbi:hypothetical protein QWX81_11340, partial [Neisseria gonorrhoeae]
IDSRRVRGPDSRLRGNDGFRDCGVVGRVSRLRCCRTGFEIAVLSDGFQDYGIVGNDGSGISTPAPRL